MSTNEKSLGKYWAYFAISVALTIVFLLVRPEWFWVMLPFVCTYFIQALDWM
jgi:hypothetical protein